MYNELSSTKTLDVRGLSPKRIRGEVKKLSRDEACAILTEIANTANARSDELNAALGSGSRREKWNTLTAAQQDYARRKIVTTQMFDTFESSELLDALTRQAHSFRTSLGNVFEVYALSENAIKERVSNLSPAEVSEVFEFVETRAEPRNTRFVRHHWDVPSPGPELLSWEIAACTCFGLTPNNAERLRFALKDQDDRLSFGPDVIESVELLSTDMAFRRELLEAIELRAQKLIEQYPDIKYRDAAVFALRKMLGANGPDAGNILDYIRWAGGGEWSILQASPFHALDTSSISRESARRYVRMIDALANNPLFRAYAAMESSPLFRADEAPEDSAARYLFVRDKQDVHALRERACEVPPLVELAADKLESDTAKTFLDGTITVSDAATRNLEQTAARAAARSRINEFITSFRGARAKAFEEHQSQQRQAAKSRSMGLSP